MKKLTALLLTLALSFSLVACGGKEDKKDAADKADPAAKSEGVMTYEEYMAAELETQVTVEAFVQGKQSWYEAQNTATVYAQDADGGYFFYDMACTAEQYEQLTVGTKIKVTGYKAEWSGEVEIIDASFEVVDGTWTPEATDVTALLGTDELVNHQNKVVSFKGMTVSGCTDADGNSVPFLYNWDGSGQAGDDVYFNVSLNDQVYSFVIESYLCNSESEAYKAATALQIGDTVDMEGFLYWYNGANPHITSITVK